MSQQFCTRCGAMLPAQGNFCPQCGAPIMRSAVPSTDAKRAGPDQGRNPASNGRRSMLFGLAALAGGVIVSAPVYYWGIRPRLTATQPGAAVNPPTADSEASPDVHDEEGIPYPEVPRIALADAKARFDDGSAVFVDVRDRDAYAAAHIPNSLLLPLDQIGARYQELPQDAQIITYCT